MKPIVPLLAILALSGSTTLAVAADAKKKAPDVKALVASNGCLGCHAVDKQLVGPAYHEVAAKYKDDPEAVAKVAASIRQGGSGKWGDAAMPPFAGLSDDEGKALAAYVLKQ